MHAPASRYEDQPLNHAAAALAQPQCAGNAEHAGAEGTRKLKILQVVGGMRRGGVETWLMHVLRGLDRDRFSMNFFVHTNDRCPFDDEIESLGSRICRHPIARNLAHYAYALRKELRRERYDVVHSHVHHFSGLVLSVARTAAIPVRVAHSHNDTLALEQHASLSRRSYLALSEWLIQRNATAGVAASREAARSLFGADWNSDPRWSILYCGIALDAFRVPLQDQSLRAEFGIPSNHLVVGHVGRFDPQKNHAFFVEVAAEIARRRPDVHFLLVGDGPLRPAIRAAFAAHGLTERTTFAGVRADVPNLMQAMDVLLFPSRFEGLPLTLLEAQAAALPAVISGAISQETDLMASAITRLSLSTDAAEWAAAVLSAGARPRPDRTACLEAIERSPFNAALSRANLLSSYQQCLAAVKTRNL